MRAVQSALVVAISLASFAGIGDEPGDLAHATQLPEDLGGIFINGDENFTAEHGVSAGNGTYLNPYIIESMEINGSSEGRGIYVQFTTAFLVIRNVTVHSGLIVLQENETSAGFTGSDGINLRTAANCRIANCTLRGNAEGISVMWGCTNIVVEHNNITGNLRGISVESCSFVTMRENYVSRNLGDNVILDMASYCTLVNNTVVAPGKWSFTSVNLYAADHCEVHGNLVTNANGLGVNVGFCSDCEVTNNTIMGNNVGITVYGSERITYSPNAFAGNSEDVQDWDSQESLSESLVVLATIIVTTFVTAIVVVVLMRRNKRNPPAGPPKQ